MHESLQAKTKRERFSWKTLHPTKDCKDAGLLITGDNTETLDFLWKLYNATNARALRESRQTKLTDFFKWLLSAQL